MLAVFKDGAFGEGSWDDVTEPAERGARAVREDSGREARLA